MEVPAVSRSIWEGRRAALVIAHPGHELLLHGWLEQARPLVFVLTSGTSADDDAGIAATARVVCDAGSRIGSLFGRYTGRGLLTAMLLGEKNRFNAVAEELADALLGESIDFVVGDSSEGLDPAHDLCRVIIDAAVGIAAQIRPSVKNYEFPLLGSGCSRSSTLRQRIEGDAWARKQAACRSYPEPIEEVQRHIANDGIDSLREECLRLATPWAIRNRRDVLYSRAENGRIPAIQFREHFLPVAGSIHGFVTGRQTRAA